MGIMIRLIYWKNGIEYDWLKVKTRIRLDFWLNVIGKVDRKRIIVE